MEIPLVTLPGLETPSRRFTEFLDAALPMRGDAIDLGTGTGRVALAVAPRVGRVVGVDVDASAVEAARAAATRLRLSNASFVQSDAEATDLRTFTEGRPYGLATARLFLSLPLIARVAQALAPGGSFVLEALDERHWAEAGGSRFNLPASAVLAALEANGLRTRQAVVEQVVHEFADARAAQEHLKDHRLWTKWKQDGRWEALRTRARRGQRTLTEAHLVAWSHRAGA